VSGPHFRIETSGRWTPEQLDVLSDAHNRLVRALEGYSPADRGAPTPGQIAALLKDREGPEMGRNTLIVGDRALASIGLVVLLALMFHTVFWSFVLPFGSIVS